MEKKELDSMKKQRGLFLAMGLAALMGLMASEAHAANLVLTVYAGSGTGGAVIFGPQNGGTQSLNGDVGTLNTNLATAGYGAYSFSSLGASSNNPGTTTNGFILVTGNMSVAAGMTGGVGGTQGADSPITIVVTESGFFSPASATGNQLTDVGQSNYVNTATDSTTMDTGTFNTSPSTPTFTLTSPAGPVFPGQSGNESVTLGAYTTPYSLTSESVISLSPGVGASSTNPASLGFSNKVLVVSAAVPEPASIVMMLTGMPLPLVVMGLLRRRRGAA
jgi:hypothetical protein